MDKSDKYILMCRNNTKLQDLWKPDDGDFYYDIDGLKAVNIWTNWRYTTQFHRYWLPRQDQLQALVMPEFEVYGCDAIEHFMDVFHGFQEENNPLFNSMEELTLAFVMHNNYQKKWNSNEWVKA